MQSPQAQAPPAVTMPILPQMAANPQQLMSLMAANPAAFGPLFPNMMAAAAGMNPAGTPFLPPTAISFPTAGQVGQTNDPMTTMVQNPLLVYQQQQPQQQQQQQQQHQQQQGVAAAQATGGGMAAASLVSSNTASLAASLGFSLGGDAAAKQRKEGGGESSCNSQQQMSSEERAKHNRDRNREHARSTRLRKKAYVQKLKELVEGLHAERTEEVRQRRVAIQHLAEVQTVRRKVVRTFLHLHSKFTADERKWTTVLEDDFWLKQPVTPYRSFRRAEIEKVCRLDFLLLSPFQSCNCL
jgi:hypothetical protein